MEHHDERHGLVGAVPHWHRHVERPRDHERVSASVGDSGVEDDEACIDARAARWVVIRGEPGIGKSRLLEALRERLDEGAHTRIRYFCSPYHTNSALHPVIGLLERTIGLDRNQPPERQRERLEAVLARATAEVAEGIPLLADLLGMPPGGTHPVLDLSPRQKKERTFRVLLDPAGHPFCLCLD